MTKVFRFIIVCYLLALVSCVHAQQVKLGGTTLLGGQTGQSSKPVLTVTTTSLPAGTANVSYTATLTAVNGISPLTWTIQFGSLPTGLSLNSSTGAITGTPTVVGNFPISVLVTDSTSPTAQTATASFVISVTCPTLQILTTSPLPPGTTGSSYSDQFLSSGGSGSISWSNPGGGLPAGLSFSSAGLLNGTPTASGSFTFNISATDSCPTAQVVTQSYTLQINSPVVITTTSPLPPATEGLAYSTQMTGSGGTTPYSWSLLSGVFPTGISINAAGLISGTPAAAGTFTPVIQVADSASHANNAPFTLVVSCTPLQITTTSPLPNGTQGQTYSDQLQSSGGTGAITWTVSTGALPAGLSLSSAGKISGTPTLPGSFTFGITATDSCVPTSQTATQNYSLTIAVNLQITTTSPLPQATVGSPYSSNMAATGGVPPYQWSLVADSFPQQLFLDHGIRLTWTQSTCSPITGNNIYRSSSSSGPFTLLYQATIPLTSYMDAQIKTGQTYFYNVTAICNGSETPASNVAQGTVGTQYPGNIKGNPTQTGTTVPTIQVTDSVGNQAQQQFQITSVCTPLSITSTSPLPQGTVNQTYSFQFQSFGGAPTINWNLVQGPLPTGLTLSATGLLSGVPTQTGTFNLIVQAIDSCLPQAQSQQQPFTLAIAANSGALTITTTSPLPSGTVGKSYSQQMQATGGTPPYAWSTSQSFPSGLSMSSAGLISGVPTQAQTSSLNIKVTDAISSQQTNAFTISTLCPALTITSNSTLPNATVGQAYNNQLTFSGGTPPVSWSATGVPSGLSLSPAGVLSGTPTTSGTFNIPVTATDSCNPPQTATQTFSLTVNAATPPLQITTASPLPGATEGSPYNQSLSASGGVPPYAWSITTGNLPPGLSLSAAGVISGTPTSAETDTPTFKVSDTAANSNTKVLSITSTCPAFSITSTSPLPTGTQNLAYSSQLTSSGGIAPVTWSGAGVPAGLTLSSGGLLSGTPTGFGTSTINVTAKDSCNPTNQSITQGFSITINPAAPPLQITTTSPLPSGTQNLAYSQTVSATGGTPPYTWSVTAGSLPTGLSLAASTGIISGTPTVAQTVTPTIQVADSAAVTNSKVFSVTINPGTAADNRYCSPSETVIGLSTDGPAAPLQHCVYTAAAGSPSNVATHTVCASGCDYTTLANALSAAVCGWTITIKATSTGTISGTQNSYTANTTLPAKNCDKGHWITIESDLVGNANFPAEGTRITPAWVGTTSLPGRPSYGQPAVAGIYLPKLISTGTNGSVLTCASGANFYRFIGLELTSPSGTNGTNMVACDAPNDHFIFDRVLSHAGNSATWQDKDNMTRNFSMSGSTYFAVIDSYVGDTHCIAGAGGTCLDSQAVLLANGVLTTPVGPGKVVNNFLESAGENIVTGDGGQVLPTVTGAPFDYEIRRNHLFKPLFWKVNDPTYFGTQFLLKNNFELKQGNRVLVEGNIFENDWGGQSDQFGTLVLFNAYPRPVSTTGNASSSGTGTLTGVTNSQFPSNVVSQFCAIPFHCTVTYNGVNYQAQTWIDNKHITVSPIPPTNSSAAFVAYGPPKDPNAQVANITFRYNVLTKASRCIAISQVTFPDGSISAGTSNISIHDNSCDGIDGFKWQIGANACCTWASAIQVQNNGNVPRNVHDVTVRHNTFIEFLTGSNKGLGPSLGFGQQKQTSGVMTNLKFYDNISAAGFGLGNTGICVGASNALAIFQCWDTLNSVAQLSFCFDHNVLATTTATTGSVTGTANNPPYPGAGQSPGCPFTTNGNSLPASYDAIQFTSLNGGTGGNYLLQGTSPYHNAASDGTDPGANINLLNQYTAGVQ